MFKKMSLTITGLLVIILSEFLPIEEAEVLVQALGVIMAWFGRVRIGDITLLGTRK